MKVVTVHAAKTTLSKLLQRAEKGEEIIIARGSTPVAKLVALDNVEPKRQFGALRGKLVVPASFFEPLPADELSEWEG
jgi:prevent-host-death family protein